MTARTEMSTFRGKVFNSIIISIVHMNLIGEFPHVPLFEK